MLGGFLSRLFRGGQREGARVLLGGLAATAMLAVACGGETRAQSPTAVTATAAAAAPPRDTDAAYKLIVASAACWLGGLWGEAEGETGAADRRTGTARRCAEVV